MAKIRLDGFIEAFHSLTKALEETRDVAAPVYREAVEEWAKETSKKAVVNLDRPNWLLSRSISQVVRKYDKTGKLWALAGVTKESSDKRDPAYYVRFHEAAGEKAAAPRRRRKSF